MAILGHHSNSTVKVVFAHSLTLYLLVSKGIARTDILERHYMLLATFMNFFVSKLHTFENLWEEYNLLSIHIDDINLQVRNSVALKMLLEQSMTKCSFTAWALHHTYRVTEAVLCYEYSVKKVVWGIPEQHLPGLGQAVTPLPYIDWDRCLWASPVHKAGPCISQEPGPVSMSMGLTGTEAWLHTRVFFLVSLKHKKSKCTCSCSCVHKLLTFQSQRFLLLFLCSPQTLFPTCHS